IFGLGSLAVTFVPSKLLTIFCNLMVLTMGGASGSPLPEETKTTDAERMRPFPSLIKSPTDLLKEDASMISHALPLIQWQLQQRTTALHLYGTKPEMGILPPQKPTPETVKKRAYLETKYLSNFGIPIPRKS